MTVLQRTDHREEPTMTAATAARVQVELYIPSQRRGEPLIFLADAHRDTPAHELLDPHRYCVGCGHCTCASCQDTDDAGSDD